MHGEPGERKYSSFKVAGAGEVRLDTDDVCVCAKSVGLSISVSWGSYGFGGGVIDAKEVEAMRDALSLWLESKSDQIEETREAWNK